MLTRCLFCHRAFEGNAEVERFPVARRIAFDPRRGRLWAVCPACSRWTLAPFEERWEALEELEKTARDRGRVLSSTENIALIDAGGVQLVQVGSARLQEEAWWRYGAELARRRSQYRTVAAAETAAQIGILILTGFGILWIGKGDLFNRLRRWNRFGTSAWQGDSTCPNCGAAVQRIAFRETKNMLVLPGQEARGDSVRLQMICWRCGATRDRGGHTLQGVAAEHTLRRIMAYHHFAGAKEDTVRSATSLIEHAGSPEHFLGDAARRFTYVRDVLWEKDQAPAFALEIALSDATERLLLELELAELEARWRQEEEIAAIVDGELTPVAGLDRLRR